MKILIFDTETGGLNAYRNDILQLSFQVIDGDTFHTLLESNYYSPWPEDKRRVEWGAIQVNGLTEEFLATQDVYDRYEVLNFFIDELMDCDLCVAHNGEFDLNLIFNKMGDRCRPTAIELLFLQFKTNLLSHRKLFIRHDSNNQSSAKGRLRPLCSYQ